MNLILEFIKENGFWESYPGNARASPRHYTPSTTSGCPFISPQWGPLPPPQLCWSPWSETHNWHCQSTCWGTKLTLLNGCLTVRNVKWRKPRSTARWNALIGLLKLSWLRWQRTMRKIGTVTFPKPICKPLLLKPCYEAPSSVVSYTPSPAPTTSSTFTEHA